MRNFCYLAQICVQVASKFECFKQILTLLDYVSKIIPIEVISTPISQNFNIGLLL
jgi:hypothetical protein